MNQTARRYLGLNLQDDVQARHMNTFYLACLAGIMLSSFMPQLLPFLLREFHQIPEARQGVVAGAVAFWGEIAIIATVGLWGTLSDKIGRRTVMAVGFIIIAVAVLLFPYARSLNELYGYRILFGLGAAAYVCMITTVIADYVKDESRGKGSGFLGIANGIGAMITVFLLLRLPSIFEGRGMTPQEAGFLTYQLVAVVALIVGIIMWFGLKPGRAASEHAEQTGFLEQAKQGLLAAKDPGVALAYGAAFVSRGNLTIVGTFFSLWIVKFSTGELDMSTADAQKQAGMIIGIAQTCVLFGAPLFGILSDRINRVTALIVALIVSFVGYGATYFIEDPTSGAMIGAAVIIGLGEVGCIIASGVLIAQQSPEKIRGAVIGFFNLSGALGILVASVIGGMLFDGWRESGPFVLFSIIALFVAMWAMLVHSRVKPVAEAM